MLNKYDIGLIAAVIICASLMALGLGQNPDNLANKLKISIDGKEYSTFDIEKDQIVNIDTKNSHNVIEIKEGAAKMIEADCPDKYCLKQGSINKGHETIVCLPNKVIVEFTANQSSVDTVVG